MWIVGIQAPFQHRTCEADVTLLHVDSGVGSVVVGRAVHGPRITKLTSASSASRTPRPRTWRGIVAIVVMAMYVLAGALHGFCEVDVTNSAGQDVIAMSTSENTDGPGKAAGGEHHCHGCFSVSVPTPLHASAMIESKVAGLTQPTADGSGLVPAIDTPPPKS